MASTESNNSWIEELGRENFLAVYDVVLDIQSELQFGASVNIPILPSVVRFPELMPVDAINMRDRYGNLRWKAGQLLQSKGVIERLDIEDGDHRWDSRLNIRVASERFQQIVPIFEREHEKRSSPKEKEGKESESVPPKQEVAEVVSLPEKVTIRWLYGHIPINAWASLFTLLVASFVGGVYVGQTTVARELIGYSPPVQISSETLQERIDELTRGHNAHVAKLTEAIAQEETSAGRYAYSMDRDPHVEAAERLRQDLRNENEAFFMALRNLKALAEEQ